MQLQYEHFLILINIQTRNKIKNNLYILKKKEENTKTKNTP